LTMCTRMLTPIPYTPLFRSWNWPTKIDRDVIERALTLDFLQQARNLVLVGRNGLGKTMIAKNICYAGVLVGHIFFAIIVLPKPRSEEHTSEFQSCIELVRSR